MGVMGTPPFEVVCTMLTITSQHYRDYKDYKDTSGDNAGTTGTALHTTLKRRMPRARLATQSEDYLISRKG
jgi:hypothetical protein